MPLQNSRDNMSAVLVTFPSAPQVSQEAIEKVQKQHYMHTSLVYSWNLCAGVDINITSWMFFFIFFFYFFRIENCKKEPEKLLKES